MSSQPRIADKVLSAPVGISAACLLFAILTGCMSLSIGNRTVEAPPCEEGVLCQQGEVHIAANSSLFVHYPLPYPRKPNIEIDSTLDDCVIAEERADGFLLRNPNCLGRTVKWKARGMRCESPPVAPNIPAPSPEPASPPTLPPPTPERNT